MPERDWSDHRFYKQYKTARRYFIKNGRNGVRYDWFQLYWAIRGFKLTFKFKYNLKIQQISADYVPKRKRWANQMLFLKFYIRMLKQLKWHQVEPKKLVGFLKKAKRACYTGLLETLA